MANITGDLNPNLIFGDQSQGLTPTPNDFISSQESSDNINGKEGNDTIFGLGGNDNILGTSGNDVLNGDDGDDQIFGGQDNDTLIGGSGKDKIQGNKGNDLLFGLGGDDNINGNRGSDQLFGGVDNDILDGGTVDPAIENKDTLTGGNGNDVFGLRAANKTLTITDYVDGADKFKIIADPLDPIVLANTGAAVTAADISVTVVGANTELNFIDDNGDQTTIAVLQNFANAALIDVTDFI